MAQIKWEKVGIDPNFDGFFVEKKRSSGNPTLSLHQK
jgi:hypothetical protein